MSTAVKPRKGDRRTDSAWVLIPTWLLSLLLHIAIVAPLAWVLRPHATQTREPEAFRVLAIVADTGPGVDAHLVPSKGVPNAPVDQAEHSPKPGPKEQPGVVSSAPPGGAGASHGAERPTRAGPGPMIPKGGTLPGTSRTGDKPGSGATRRGIPTGKGTGTSFFGVTAERGSRFVYVIDASGSMSQHNAFSVAKAELLASLEALDENQQFQVVFYNDDVITWKRDGNQQTAFFASEINKNLVGQFVRGFTCRGGTRHMLGLEAGLRLNPEVLFFLTDANEPELSAGEIDKIKRACASKTTIHTVEFGVGEQLKTDTFLKKLARATGGQSAYRDVQKFD